MNKHATFSKYALFISTLLFVWLATSIRWVTTWELKAHCFEKENITLQSLLRLDTNSKWSASEREGIPKPLWRVPSLESTITEPYLIEQGFTGYLLNTSSDLNAVALDKDTQIHLTGELLFHRYSWIDRIFDNTELVLAIPVLVDGKKYLTYDFLLTEDKHQLISTSPCLK